MWHQTGRWFGALALMVVVTTDVARAEPAAGPVAMVCPKGGVFVEQLAKKEVRRYYYLRTGKLLPVFEQLSDAPQGDVLLVGYFCGPRCTQVGLEGQESLADAISKLGREDYLLKTIEHRGRRILVITGWGRVGPLYGAYRFAERIGVRFYMHGDVVPDRQIEWQIPDLNEQGTPLFALRGIQPFHDFPEGPDWWTADAYKAIFAQLPKMGMNFFGLHTYPEGGVGPEPTTWIGRAEDLGEGAEVKASYPSRHFATMNYRGMSRRPSWGYMPTKTSDYLFGAAAMFDRDDFGPDTMRGLGHWVDMSAEQCNELFERTGLMLDDVFSFARRMGIKTCLGTETPLVIPAAVKKRLEEEGKDPSDPAVVQEIYEAMFRRIKQTHPLDYYWLWTPEGWTWQAVSQKQIDATMADFDAAIQAAANVKAPFRLATCGWVLGPPQDPSLFDKVLPKSMAMSCINRQVGHAPVEPGFAQVEDRPQWAIPWLEDDPAMIIPQLWVGRMRCDAADALKYGCTGLMGIHWRTRILGPNVSALAQAAWDQSGWNPDFGKSEAAVEPAAMPEGPVGGKIATFPGNEIDATGDDPLYQAVRYDVDAYRINVPSGIYNVKLQFCEPHYTEPGKRVFSVKLQGKPVIERLDVFEEVGQNKALDFTFEDVNVTGDQLVIEFGRIVELPCIAAIVVDGPTAQRRINCGGPAYRDYQADLAPGSSGKPRHLPAGDFYADWARTLFGDEAAEPIAELFTRLDGKLPRPATWVGGPGGLRPDARPWEEVRKEYAFVDELAALRPRITGAGNLERFDYWLANFRYLRTIGQVNCTWARLNAAMKKVLDEKDPAKQKILAQQTALPIRKELVALVTEVHRDLLATVTTAGAMGTVANWQQHVMPMLLGPSEKDLARILGGPLPDDAVPSPDYTGKPRMFVPVVRTSLFEEELLNIEAIVLGIEPKETIVYWRPLGAKTFAKVPLEHVARGVYRVTLPAEAVEEDLEYYVEVTSDGGPVLRFPATAPALNQTVVVVKK